MSIKSITAVCLLALVLSACSPLLVRDVEPSGEQAHFTLSIPAIAPFVVMDKGGASARATPRLYMAATSVSIRIYDGWFSGLRGSWDFPLTITPEKEYSATETFDLTMPTGYFMAWVRVYNSNASDTPTAEWNSEYYSWADSSGGWTVTLAGPNEFDVCVSPTTITRIDPNVDTARYETQGPFDLNQYGEAWFVFDNRTVTTHVDCATTAGDADLYVFDSADHTLVGPPSVLEDLATDSITLTQDANVHHDFIIGIWGYDPDTTYTLTIVEETAGGSVEVH